jgi:hypothetical protein
MKKIIKQKVDSGRKSKVSEKKVCLFLPKVRVRGSFQISTLGAWQIAIFAQKNIKSFSKALKYVYLKVNIFRFLFFNECAKSVTLLSILLVCQT